MTLESLRGPAPGVIGLCIVLWAASFLVPLYFLPVTMFAGMWLAVLVWGFAASGGRPLLLPGEAALPAATAFAVPALLVVFAALAVRDHPVEAALLLVAAGTVCLGLLGGERPWLVALLWGLVLAAGLNALIAWVQIFLPAIDSALIAPLATAARATGNLRQPNQFASLCLFGIVAAIVLVGTGRLRPVALAWALALLLGTGIAFSRSRTGLLGMVMLVAWVVLDRRLPRGARAAGLAALFGLALGLAVLWLKSLGGEAAFDARAGSSDYSAQRFGIWANTLELIRQHPLTGVGWGNFGWAWALTPFPGRPVAFFDNAHNLPLQLLVELGLPLGLFSLGLLLWTLWRARGSWHDADTPRAIESRGLWVMLAYIGLHSLLEYPLWYSYFLLPTAFFLGVLVRRGSSTLATGPQAAASQGLPDTPAAGGAALWSGKALQAFGVLVVATCLYAAWDYMRVLQAFSPFGPGLRQSLEQRVDAGRRSIFFGYWVEYGVLTNADTFKGLEGQFRRPLRNHVNSHLLMQYAKALHERGEDDKAAHVADRLREFHHPISAKFLAECDAPPAGAEPPFQCARPQRTYVYTDFD